ncbi:MAG: magnesium/cobalt transporter CorA [Cyclobacteriaceae bacterium]|nr:magnesium/cobalt transporter CorA [Cyclobacteriaceae bacterium]
MKKKRYKRNTSDSQKFIFTGEQYEEKTSLQLFRYNQSEYDEKAVFNEKEFVGFPNQESQYWLNIHGIHDVELITNICKKLGVHNLVIQDILDVNHRPKFHAYESIYFFSIKSILPSVDIELESEQLSFVLGKNFLVSFQEKKADYFEHIRQRIRSKSGILNERTPDYLLYLLLEAILDNYFVTLDNIEKQLNDLGLIDLEADPSPTLLKELEMFKRPLQNIKKVIIPIKEFVLKIEREKGHLIHEKHMKYFVELKETCMTLIDFCDKVELRLESSINLFFSIQTHRMNQVMKTLTVVATIFIPLTFITGIYGMNFTIMPELSWEYGYYFIWGIIIFIFTGMLIYFKKKNWY